MDFDLDEPGDVFAFRRYIEDIADDSDDSRIDPNLIREITHFHPLKSLSLVAGLLMEPKLAANNIRIEFLVKAIQRNGGGSATPKRSRIDKWLNTYLGAAAIARAEDPPEDVFIGNVVCGLGNVRIFCGTWEQTDGLLQDSLAALNTLPQHSAIRLLSVEAQALLALSEEVAARIDLPRWTVGKGERVSALQLPEQSVLSERASMLRFTRNDLRELHITRAALSGFIHEDRPNARERGLNTLERRPLLRDGEDFLLVLPTAISVAIRARIIDTLRAHGELDHFAVHLVNVQMGDVMNESRPALKARRLQALTLPPIPEEAKFVRQELLTFDSGKYAHLLFIEDDLEAFALSGPHIVRGLARSGSMLVGHIDHVARFLADRPDYSGGLTLIIVGGIGGASMAGLPQLPTQWFSATFRTHDLRFVAQEREVTLLRLWKLKRHLLLLKERRVDIPDVNGDLNLISYWLTSGQRLVPPECDIRERALLVTPMDALAQVRYDLRSKYDSHVVASATQQMWLEVFRLRAGGLWNHEHEQLIYVTKRSPGNLLEGIIETAERPWWLIIHPPSPEFPKMRDSIRRIWDALLDWYAKAARVAERTWSSLPQGPIEIRIEFRAIPVLEREQWNTFPADEKGLTIRLGPEMNCAAIVVHPHFFRLFTNVANDAERAFLKAMLQVAGKLAGSEPAAAALERMADAVMPNSASRGFHVTNASEFRHRFDSFWDLEPSFIEDGDLNEQLLGLAFEVPGAIEPGTIQAAERCTSLCNDAVEVLWRRTKALLVGLDRFSLILHCVLNVEACDRDSEQWRISANAILSTDADEATALTVARERESQRARSAITSRVLVEMAVCECPLRGGDLICGSTFDALRACVTAMIDLANQSDAIRWGLAVPEVTVSPSGELQINRSYQNDVVVPYLNGHFAEQFRAAADDYISRYETSREGEAPKMSLPEQFLSAFFAEYGLAFQRLLEAIDFLQDDALRRDELVVITTNRAFVDKLIGGGFTPSETDSILTHFALRPRTAWDSTPPGFRKADWFPWRYSRRLSLFSRPFIRCSDSDDGEFIYAPGFVLEAIGSVVTYLHRAVLPKEFCHSIEMRSWGDAETRRSSSRFEASVGAEFRTLGWEARHSVRMTELGATNLYGDLDTLAWNPRNGFVCAGECKNLRFARTVGEICDKLRNFKGETKDGLDDLGRHIRRWHWLYHNRTNLARITGIAPDHQTILPLLITNTLVPMQFIKTLPLDARFIFQKRELADRLPLLVSLDPGAFRVPASSVSL